MQKVAKLWRSFRGHPPVPAPLWTPRFISGDGDAGARVVARQKGPVDSNHDSYHSQPEYMEGNSRHLAGGGDDERLKLDGFLFKYAQGKSRVGMKNWKQRYFQLTATRLSYYDKPCHEKDNPAGVEKGHIDLSNVLSVREVSSSVACLSGDVF